MKHKFIYNFQGVRKTVDMWNIEGNNHNASYLYYILKILFKLIRIYKYPSVMVKCSNGNLFSNDKLHLLIPFTYNFVITIIFIFWTIARGIFWSITIVAFSACSFWTHLDEEPILLKCKRSSPLSDK